MKALKKKMEKILALKQIPQKTAAEEIGVTPMTLNRFFRTDSELRAEAMVRLCLLCGVDVEDALELETRKLEGEELEDLAPAGQLYRLVMALDDSKRKILGDFLEPFLAGFIKDPKQRKASIRGLLNPKPKA